MTLLLWAMVLSTVLAVLGWLLVIGLMWRDRGRR
jgi:hypothetical protein